MNDYTVTFEVTDFSNPSLETLAISISENAIQTKWKLNDLVEFLKRSGNSIESYKRFFVRWEQTYSNRKAPPDVRKFRDEIKKIGDVCSDDKDWQKLRGLIAEELYKKYFEGEYNNFRRSYGAKVKINNEDVIYTPRIVTNQDKRKVSVDAGAWNGIFGEFVEVKFSVSAIEEKDLNYMKYLNEKLSEKYLTHKLTIVCFDDESFIKAELISKGMWSSGSVIQIINYHSLLN